MLELQLVRALAKSERLHAFFSFVNNRPIQGAILNELHVLMCEVHQHMLINGQHDELAYYFRQKLFLESQLDMRDTNWTLFSQWVSKCYGSPNVGSMVFHHRFDHDTTKNLLEKAINQISSPIDIASLFAISQFTKCEHPAFDQLLQTLLDSAKCPMHILRALSEWTSLMRVDDANLKMRILSRLRDQVTNKNTFITATYISEKLAASQTIRYDLLDYAIDASHQLGLDDQVVDYIHSYLLRYMSQDELQHLHAKVAQNAIASTPFGFSILQSIEAWIHIDISAFQPQRHIQETISKYLSLLCEDIYPPTPNDLRQSSTLSADKMPYTTSILQRLVNGDHIDDTEIQYTMNEFSRDFASLKAA